MNDLLPIAHKLKGYSTKKSYVKCGKIKPWLCTLCAAKLHTMEQKLPTDLRQKRMQNVENANAEMRHENGWILHILGRESALIMWAESRHYACHSTTYFCRHYAKAFSTYCIRFCRKAAVKCRCRRVQIGDILSANFSKLFVGLCFLQYVDSS